MKVYNVPLVVPSVYNLGEWRLSKQVTGPRGGKSWKKIYGFSAIGFHLPDVFLSPGHYKIDVWSNGCCSKYEFIVSESGERIDL